MSRYNDEELEKLKTEAANLGMEKSVQLLPFDSHKTQPLVACFATKKIEFRMFDYLADNIYRPAQSGPLWEYDSSPSLPYYQSL